MSDYQHIPDKIQKWLEITEWPGEAPSFIWDAANNLCYEYDRRTDEIIQLDQFKVLWSLKLNDLDRVLADEIPTQPIPNGALIKAAIIIYTEHVKLENIRLKEIALLQAILITNMKKKGHLN